MKLTQILGLPLLFAIDLPLYAAQNAAGPSRSVTADANPAFAVVTVKPSDPANTNWALGTRGTHFFSSNTNVDDLISFAYGIHTRQIVAGPAWFHTDKYDIEGVSDIEGKPTRQQLASMVQDYWLIASNLPSIVTRRKLRSTH
jgi:hypothetical protein